MGRKKKAISIGLVFIFTVCVIFINSLNNKDIKPITTDTTDTINTIDTIDGTESTDITQTFIDDDGKEIVVDKPFERIISLYSAHTENIYYLGAGDKIIGGPKSGDFPVEVKEKPTFEFRGDPEEIIAHNPDLVLIRPLISRKVPEFVEALENAGITVVSLYPDKFEDFDEYIMNLALLTGTVEVAKQELENMRKNISIIENITKEIEKKQTVFFEASIDETRTVTDESMPGQAIKFAGGVNIAGGLESISEGGSIASYGVERVLENADNIDVYISQKGAMSPEASVWEICARPGYDTIAAINNNRVYIIDEKLISSPTFRYYKGVYELARFLYPEEMNTVESYNTVKEVTRSDVAVIFVKSLNLPMVTQVNLHGVQGHTYGKISDITFKDEHFDFIETAIDVGIMETVTTDGLEYFHPEYLVTKDELAKMLFTMVDYDLGDISIDIKDMGECTNKDAISAMVILGVMDLNDDGYFEPEKKVTGEDVINAIKKLLI